MFCLGINCNWQSFLFAQTMCESTFREKRTGSGGGANFWTIKYVNRNLKMMEILLHKKVKCFIKIWFVWENGIFEEFWLYLHIFWMHPDSIYHRSVQGLFLPAMVWCRTVYEGRLTVILDVSPACHRADLTVNQPLAVGGQTHGLDVVYSKQERKRMKI